MAQGIRVVTTKPVGLYPKGAEFEFESAAKADATLGDGAYKITGNADGTPHEAPKAEKPDKDAKAE